MCRISKALVSLTIRSCGDGEMGRVVLGGGSSAWKLGCVASRDSPRNVWQKGDLLLAKDSALAGPLPTHPNLEDTMGEGKMG